MRRLVRFGAVFYVLSIAVFAENWSGILVDAKCYASRQRNVNPREPADVATDKSLAIRYCAAEAKTKSFAIVQQDGSSFKLDAAANEKVLNLIRSAGKKSLYHVDVTGQLSQDTIEVNAVSIRP